MTRYIATLLLACCLTMPTAYETALAQADDAVALPPGYERAVERGLDEFEAGNFAEARSHFVSAHGIFPNARTLRALGKAEYELKNYAESARYFGLALASSVRPLTTAQRIEVQRLLESTRAYLSRYAISTAPADATLLLNGDVLELPGDRTLVLAVGDHVLEARAEGFLSERRALSVVGGETRRVHLELRPVVVETPALVAQAPPAPDPAVRDDRTPLRKKWWLWTGVAGVVTGAVVAAVLLTVKQRDAGELPGGNTGVIGRVGPSGASQWSF